MSASCGILVIDLDDFGFEDPSNREYRSGSAAAQHESAEVCPPVIQISDY